MSHFFVTFFWNRNWTIWMHLSMFVPSGSFISLPLTFCLQRTIFIVTNKSQKMFAYKFVRIKFYANWRCALSLQFERTKVLAGLNRKRRTEKRKWTFYTRRISEKNSFGILSRDTFVVKHFFELKKRRKTSKVDSSS